MQTGQKHEHVCVQQAALVGVCFKERGISGNRAILVLSCDHAAFLIHYSQGGRVVNSCTFRRSKWSLH